MLITNEFLGRGGDRGGRGGGPRESRPGDWDCTSCGATGIFASRRECFKCKEPKPGKFFKWKIF